MKNDEKSEQELTCRLKIDIRKLTNFAQALESLKNLHFNGLLLTKIYNAWAKKVKRSYISGICFHQKRTKLLKLGLSLNLFMQNRKCITSKIAGQLCVMTMKNDANWIDLPVQNWHEKFNNFNWNLRNLILTRALEHLKKLHLNGLLLTKVYNVSAEKVQKRFVWWHSRLIQNLKKNWFVVSKMTWGI